jgi:hypothetical protein
VAHIQPMHTTVAAATLAGVTVTAVRATVVAPAGAKGSPSSTVLLLDHLQQAVLIVHTPLQC